jgi:diguanylate cyclase (GGDEF)-like protein
VEGIVKARANILIVDDSPTIREYIKVTLLAAKKQGFNKVLEAENGRDALEILSKHSIDLILCDVLMPEMDGFTFLKEIKANPAYFDIPVIMLTAEESVEKKVKGLESGASDYVTKPFDESELIARVRVHLKIKRLQDELKEANERYRRLSITDDLTGLYNRRYFFEILEREFERAVRYHLPLALVIIDVDHFKEVNDNFGHLQGDVILTEIASLITGNLRSHDIVARYGGEEFVLLLPMASGDTARSVSEKIRRLIERHRFKGAGDHSITVSIGVCTYPTSAVERIDDLISLADGGLYEAKREGRNSVVIHDN